MRNSHGLALGFLTVLFWSTSATAFKITLRYIDVLQLLFYAIITATVIFGTYLVANKKFREIFKLQPREYVFYLVMGFLNPFVYYWMAVKAYDLLPAQIVQPINYTWVITLSLLSIPFLKQAVSKIQIAASLICYASVVVLSYRNNTAPGSEINYFGVFLAISCTIIWALYWIYNVRSKHDPIIAIFLNFFFSIPFIGVACFSLSSFELKHLEGLYGAVWVGCFEFGFAFITWISALRSSSNTHGVTNLIFLTPFISLIFIHNVLGEEILLQTYIGFMLIISGIVWQKYNDLKLTRKPAALKI
ncbi:MAG: DMT family transporter [Proteobacteria bacterium]|nr:DMT family transporter [Pseudomonadota bacterium]MBU1586074.1 DMT family transporter [Pseudomonadota bacterium]MBU2628323.1 DMT family transporter [Pseudomonadota bacterium]